MATVGGLALFIHYTVSTHSPSMLMNSQYDATIRRKLALHANYADSNEETIVKLLGAVSGGSAPS